MYRSYPWVATWLGNYESHRHAIERNARTPTNGDISSNPCEEAVHHPVQQPWKPDVWGKTHPCAAYNLGLGWPGWPGWPAGYQGLRGLGWEAGRLVGVFEKEPHLSNVRRAPSFDCHSIYLFFLIQTHLAATRYCALNIPEHSFPQQPSVCSHTLTPALRFTAVLLVDNFFYILQSINRSSHPLSPPVVPRLRHRQCSGTNIHASADRSR